MQRVTLDFAHGANGRRRIPWIIASLLLAALVYCAIQYGQMQRKIAVLDGNLDSKRAEPQRPGRPSMEEEKAQEAQRMRWEAAQSIVQRLNIPWASLFEALEDSANADVAIQRIEPDAQHREVRITLETDKVAKAFAYAGSLRRSDALAHVYVASQKESVANSGKTIQVIVAGQWLLMPPKPATQTASAKLDLHKGDGEARW
jgi:hypothetical protein